MTSKERVLRAIRFQEPDRIPIDLWCLPNVYLKHGRAVDELVKKHPIDFVYIQGYPVKLKPLYEVGIWEDEWGCVWQNEVSGIAGQVIRHPLEDYRALKNFQAPLKVMKEMFKKESQSQPNQDLFWLGNGGDLFHRMCFLRGMEKVMLDLMEGDHKLYELREILWDFLRNQVRLWTTTAVDGIVFWDDWGSQQQLLISPVVWRSFIKPVYQDLFQICKEKGKLVFFHSDGYIMEIIEDFIELGVDALNCQVWCMGPELLGSKFRGRITFWGEICRQHILPRGTPDEVHEAARKMKKCLATDKGGLIGEGEVDGLTPLANIEALLTAWN